jgi:NADH-quinone oxidoreductase subunit J
MLLWGSLTLFLLFVVLVGIFRDLLYAAISLALASIMLSLVLFSFGANVAAVFELSVCAGLITVLFVSTVSLTKDSDQKTESRIPALFMVPLLVVFLGAGYFLTMWLVGTVLPAPVPATQVRPFAETFWGQRTTDVLGQVSLILVGVFGILAIFRVRKEERHHG